MDLMKKIFSVLLLVFSLSLYPQKSSKPIEVEEFVLDNGLTVMLSENNESPNISVSYTHLTLPTKRIV